MATIEYHQEILETLEEIMQLARTGELIPNEKLCRIGKDGNVELLYSIIVSGYEESKVKVGEDSEERRILDENVVRNKLRLRAIKKQRRLTQESEDKIITGLRSGSFSTDKKSEMIDEIILKCPHILLKTPSKEER